jgi:hypothetical protein
MAADATSARWIRGYCGLCIDRCGTVATVENGRFSRLANVAAPNQSRVSRTVCGLWPTLTFNFETWAPRVDGVTANL